MELKNESFFPFCFRIRDERENERRREQWQHAAALQFIYLITYLIKYLQQATRKTKTDLGREKRSPKFNLSD